MKNLLRNSGFLIAVFLGLSVQARSGAPLVALDPSNSTGRSAPVFSALGALSPEKLLPDDTLLLITAPDVPKLQACLKQTPQLQFWNDPAMKAFRDTFTTHLQDEFVAPLERELNANFSKYLDLLQGQLTFAVTRNGWQGAPGQGLGYVLLLDCRDRSGQLKTNLADLGKRWVESGRKVRVEKIRQYDFSIFSVSSNDVPKTLRRFVPRQMPYHELGEPQPKESPSTELVIGQADSLLLAANSVKLVERILARVGGGAVPTIGEQAAYQSWHQVLFREAPLYGWANIKAFVAVLVKQAAEKKENPEAPNPFDFFKMDKVLTATGLAGLSTVAFAYKQSPEGALWQVSLAVPESSRAGVLKILAGEPKETIPAPTFVPGDVVKFRRWRIDGQKAWATLEAMLKEISPQSLSGLNFIFETANQAAQENDPGFDVRKSLIGNLGDDLILYEKAPHAATAQELDSASVLLLLGSAKPEQLAASVKNILIFLTAQAGAPNERELLGRKIYSVPLPTMPISLPGAAPAPPTSPRTLHYCASGGYVAFSTDAAMLEEYLRSSESKAKTLRETAGLAEAAQQVTGPGTSFFGFENCGPVWREIFDVLKNDPGASTNITALKMLSSVPGMSRPEQNVRDWMDFSLLPPFDRVAKYFHFQVSGSSTTVDGITYKLFSPTPPATR